MGNISSQNIALSYSTLQRESKPIFFNHIDKTGGTTLSGILFTIAVTHGRPMFLIPVEYGLHHDPVPTEFLTEEALVYCGHTTFGFHRQFERDFNLITLVRNPAERVVSDYFWRRRFENRREAISFDDFAHFLKHEARYDQCAKFLCGIYDGQTKVAYEKLHCQDSDKEEEVVKRQVGDRHDLSAWKDNLETYFAYSSTENLMELASFVLTQYGSASVVFGDAKKESDPRRQAYTDHFKDDILNLNKVDYDLYQYVKGQEHRFQVADKSEDRINWIFIRTENGSAKGYTFTHINVNQAG